MTATYATTLDLARYLVIDGSIPNRKSTGTDRPDELIGTGDGSTTKFYTDNAFILNNSYTFRYSASETDAGTALVENTDFTIDKDRGIITLTATGLTNVGTDNIYGEYEYCTLDLTDTYLQETLDAAQDEIDDETGSHWANGTDTTPDYIQVTNEKHRGKGAYDRSYYSDRYPLPDLSASITGTAVAVGDTTIWVDDTQGFLDSGIIGIETDKVTYTGKTGSAFTGCSGVLSAHGTATNIKPYIIEISSTEAGSTPTWQILNEGTDFDVDLSSGRFYVYRDDFVLDTFTGHNAPKIPNRLRLTYIYGNTPISKEISRLCKMIAAKDLLHTAVRKAHISGKNNFDPSLIDVDEKWIMDTLLKHTNNTGSNV